MSDEIVNIQSFETPQAADARAVTRLFLEKLELLTPEERKEILAAIRLLNHPLFVSR